MNKYFFLIIFFMSGITFAQTTKINSNGQDDNALLSQYVQAKGANSISFDASNIKQFWIDKSVVSMQDNITILLNEEKKSIPLRIQLANVDEELNCTIDIISKSSDFSFRILKDDLTPIKASINIDSFVQYSIISSSFHLYDTPHFAFNILFDSKESSMIEINKIVLSFSKNKENIYLESPGVFMLSEGNYETNGNVVFDTIEDNTFSITGKNSSLISTKRILVQDNTLNLTASVKNTGKTWTYVYFGYAPFTKDGEQIDDRHNPYSNKLFKVISSEDNSRSIFVDSYPEWEKNCYLVIDAKEDFSDFPNYSFVPGKILDVKKIDNEHTEIILDTPIKKAINKGTLCRIHSPLRSGYIYTYTIRLAPGEEQMIETKIKRDEKMLLYSSKSFSKDCFYVKPVILSYTIIKPENMSEENTIRIQDYSIEY